MSWLDQVEPFFSVLTRRVLRNRDLASREDLIDRLETYMLRHNQTANPYRWTYKASRLK